MGMAASQARLLSITSRMSDNELRAQLINNAKIRLTEDSSKASEKYISALNQTQLMMSNKDAQGNDLYQQLTFNNLTAYSSYNNQYGLINKSGEMVVSELDAAKYEQAIAAAEGNEETDALTEFLKLYGLEKDTSTYWETNANVLNTIITDYGLTDDMKTRYEGDIEYDADGNRISGLHYGYEMSKTSTEMGVYERLLDDYTKADNAYTNAVIKEMKTFLFEYKPNGYTTGYEDMYNDVVGGTKTDQVTGSFEALNYINLLFNELTGDDYIITETTDADGNTMNTVFYDNMNYLLNESIEFDSNGSSATITTSTDFTDIGNNQYSINNGAFIVTYNEGSTPPYSVAGSSSEGESGSTSYSPGAVVDNGDGTYSFTYTCTETETDEEDGSTTSSTKNGTCTFSPTGGAAIMVEEASADEIAHQVKYIYKYFNQNVLSQMDRDKFADSAPTEKAAYEAAAKQLSIFIFGYDIGSQDYDKLDDMEWILESGIPTTNLDSTSTVVIDQVIGGASQQVSYQTNFEAVLDVYLIESMIDLLGAPKYTWVDKTNPDENADAKAQWYTNIFNKMNEDGYQSISAELAKDPDWIKYAFESGLLSMIQVDDEFQWVSTMYSNCSDITEDTVDLMITQAEAEYTRETNKIQAKDKLYDLELKNIDTEHEALQTEYDSIKSALDKNVERHFKYFS